MSTVRTILAERSASFRKWLQEASAFRSFAPLIDQLAPKRVEDLEVMLMDLASTQEHIRGAVLAWSHELAGKPPGCHLTAESIFRFLDPLVAAQGQIAQALYEANKHSIDIQALVAVPLEQWIYVASVLSQFVGLMQ